MNDIYPDWALWIAKDQDGCCWVYEAEPHQFHKGWYENEVGRYLKVANYEGFDEQRWEHCLLKLKSI